MTYRQTALRADRRDARELNETRNRKLARKLAQETSQPQPPLVTAKITARVMDGPKQGP